MTECLVQPQLEPVQVMLPLRNDLGRIDGQVGMLHANGLNVLHLSAKQGYVFQTSFTANLVLTQGLKAEAKALASIHVPMLNPRRTLRQGGVDG